MSRFTDLFQPKPESSPSAPVAEKKEVITKSDKVVEIGRWKQHKTK